MAKLFHSRSKNHENSTEGYRNVATIVEERVDAFLSLHATYLGVSKASLVRSMLNDWCEQLSVTEKEMIEHLVSEAYQELSSRLANKSTNQSDDKILDDLKTEIWNTAKRSKRGLYDYQIQKIVGGIDGKREEEKRKNESAT